MRPAVKPAFCYVTDFSYLAPTLVSIYSLRKTLSTNIPIFLIISLKENEDIKNLSELFYQFNIEVLSINHRDIENMSTVWSASHVSKAALGRLLMHNVLPTDIDRIVYLDGDTFITSDLIALALMAIPSGRIGMVEDALSFYRNDNSENGRSTREYLNRIGLMQDDAYGNSGVMVANRDDWKSLSLDAIAYLKHSSERCPPYHDQSAINAVIGSRRINLSTKWNCQSRFAQWDGTAVEKASLLHFTGAEKPWMGLIHPWLSFCTEISNIIEKLRSFNIPIKTMSAAEVETYNSQFTRPTYVLRKYFDVRLRRRPRLIQQYDSNCIL